MLQTPQLRRSRLPAHIGRRQLVARLILPQRSVIRGRPRRVLVGFPILSAGLKVLHVLLFKSA